MGFEEGNESLPQGNEESEEGAEKVGEEA